MREPVTIVMPVRNGAHHLSKIISNLESLIEPRDEIIVIDDDSEDETAEILKSWQKRNSQVVVLRNTGRGLVSALNFGVSMSSNNWIARVDVDDRYPPDRLTRQFKQVTEDTVLVFSDYDIYSEHDQYLGTIPTAVHEPFVTLSLLTGQRSPHPSALFRKDSFIEAGCYREEDFPAEDLSLWVRLSMLGSLASAPESLLHYFINSNSITDTNRERMQIKRSEVVSEMTKLTIPTPTIVSSLKQLKRKYRGLNYSSERLILSYRDVFLWFRINNMQLPVRYWFMVTLVIANPAFWITVSRLVLESTRRRRIRKN